MLKREVAVGQDVLRRVLQQRRGTRKPAAQSLGHLPQLRHRRGMIRLGEDRPDDRRDGLAGALGHRGQEIPHEVDTTPLPRRAAEHRLNRLLQPFVRIGNHQLHALQAALHQTPQKRRPERAILRGPDVNAQHLPVALARDADGDDGRLADHPPVDPDLEVRRIDPQIAVLARQRARAKRRHHRVELPADARDLRFRHPVEAEPLQQVIDLPRRHAVHVGFLHDRQQRMLGPPAGLQQRREIGPGRDLGDRQLDRPHARIPPPGPGAIAKPAPRLGALMALGADQPGDLRLHQRLRQHSNPFAQDIAILLLEELANKRRQIHPWLGHRHRPPCVSFRQKELT
ncbi:hypothetical protein D3C83_00740 [compost metagenome]